MEGVNELQGKREKTRPPKGAARRRGDPWIRPLSGKPIFSFLSGRLDQDADTQPGAS